MADIEGLGCDSEAARMLPWFVTGRLPVADSERVRSHLEHCAICRADLAGEQSVRAVLRADERVEYAPQAGLAKTLARIDELARDAPVAEPPARVMPAARVLPRRFAPAQWLTAAVVVQALGLGVLGAALLNRSAPDRADPRYQTLTAPAPLVGSERIRAVFAPATTLAELESLLGAAHLLVVDGPSPAGAFTLAVAGGSGAGGEALARLRADHHVLFAEPAVNDRVTQR
jgi:hypothetical protein